MKIAGRFNAGFGRRSPQVPKGRLISQWRALSAENMTEIGTDAGPPKHSVVPSGLVRFAIFPGVETPGYSQTSLRDVSRQQRTRIGRLKVRPRSGTTLGKGRRVIRNPEGVASFVARGFGKPRYSTLGNLPHAAGPPD
jgi:hypothetical protein